MKVRHLCLVDTMRRWWHQSKQRIRSSGREVSHVEVGQAVVNVLYLLDRGRKRLSRNRRSLTYACRSLGVLVGTFEVLMSQSGNSTEFVYQERVGGLWESLFVAFHQLGVL